ncbi:MAG: MMPL family transporter [Candidatus Saccharimonadaceae bacterium]
MGNKLQQLGELMFKLKWWVVAVWVVIIAVLGVVVSQVGFNTTSDISIPGTQAQTALTRFNELFPDTGAQSAKVVIEVPAGKQISDYKTQIDTLAKNVATVDGVTAAITPYVNTAAVSKDGTIGFITVQMKGKGGSGRLSEETIKGVNDYIQKAQIDDVTIVAGGDLVQQGVGEILGVGEISGLVLALVVLVVTLGSLIAAGMPLVTALIALGVSMLGLFSLSKTIDLTNTAPTLAVMLGLAVGIDYSLFIINRYRTYVIDGYEIKKAAGRAVSTAGNAVIFAAATVVIALAALSVVQIPFMTVMGLAAAGTVAIAALVAITLIPAMLGITKLHLFSRKTQRAIKAQELKGVVHHENVSHKTRWYHLGEKLTKYRKTTLVIAFGIIVLLAWPMTHLQLGLPTDETAAKGTSSRQAYELLAKGFGNGYNGPLLLVVEGTPATSVADTAAVSEKITEQYQTQLATKAQSLGITVQQLMMSLTPQQLAEGQATLKAQVAQYAPYYQLQLIAERMNNVDGVNQAQAVLVTDNGTKGVIQVTPTTGPSDEATKDLVAYFRKEDNQAALTKSSDVSIGVTGTTAVQIDINKKLADAMPVYLAVVVGLSFLILMIAFRSILIPIKATLGFLLSVAAMFGALVAVFQWGWLGITDAPGPIVSFIPIIAIGILFGLAMDYEFFLVSGMQEAFHFSKDAKRAVVDGYAIGSRVVVAAALIMVSVFGGFITNHDATIQSIGFALSIGVFVDAFIVRLMIVPVVMSYLGKAAWWLPKWLDKILPKISIEGK